MTNLLVGFPQLAGLVACFSRIQEFLLLTPWPGAKDQASPEGAQPPCEVEASESGMELRDGGSSPPEKEIGALQPLVEFADASIAPSVDAEPVLRGVNLQILPLTLTVVVGPVGSGKTTLLRALLGEGHIGGRVMFGIGQTSTAYCDQVSWVRNISIRDNIVGPTEFDQAWYDTVLSCCLLREDLREIPGGDKALAGSGGARLSGGQKQRVVRLIYSSRAQ